MSSRPSLTIKLSFRTAAPCSQLGLNFCLRASIEKRPLEEIKVLKSRVVKPEPEEEDEQPEEEERSALTASATAEQA